MVICAFTMISNIDAASGTPILDSIQEAANQINVPDIQEGQATEIKIVVKDSEYQFVIWKEGGEIKTRYDGDFRLIIQKDSIDLIEKLVYAPETIRFECRDNKNNLIVHVMCWRGLEKYAKHFTNKENSIICDFTGWTALHYACHSDNLEAVQSIFQNGDERALKIIDNYENCPIDLTDNDNVRNFLMSSHFDFQTMFRTSYKAAQSVG